MKLVLQRVSSVSVVVKAENYSASIGPGLLILVGVEKGDGEAEVLALAEKTAGLRIFSDEARKMNLSILDIQGEILSISQFTLLANTEKGRRPSFEYAAPPESAKPLYEKFCEALEAKGVRKVARGVFGAHMEVSLVNDGPVTFVLEKRFPPLEGGSLDKTFFTGKN